MCASGFPAVHPSSGGSPLAITGCPGVVMGDYHFIGLAAHTRLNVKNVIPTGGNLMQVTSIMDFLGVLNLIAHRVSPVFKLYPTILNYKPF
jgi:hypothetical protein